MDGSGRSPRYILLACIGAAASWGGACSSIVAAERPSVRFESNLGQTDPEAYFLARGPGYWLFLTSGGAVLQLAGAECEGRPVVRTRFVGANPGPEISASELLPGFSSYFLGNDSARWHRRVPAYASVRYAGLYPGIDLVYRSQAGAVEYDFIVEPGADPGAIALRFEGAEDLSITREGDLLLRLPQSELRQSRPRVYSEGPSGQQSIDGRFVLRGEGVAGFEVAGRDPSLRMVIDPEILYSTYIGALAVDACNAIAVDADGNAYVTGSTFSPAFPVEGAYQEMQGSPNVQCAFVTKLDPGGTDLVYSTFLGGPAASSGQGIAVDPDGNAYVAGFTLGDDFPATSGPQLDYGGGGDAFITKLGPDGDELVYSTYLGGPSSEKAVRLALDPARNVHVTGSVGGSGFPAVNALYPSHSPGADQQDAFVAKLGASGASYVYATYLGGNAPDDARGIATDPLGNTYVVGETHSEDFPLASAFQSTMIGAWDGFLTKISADGSTLVYSTYLGGTGGDSVEAIAVDSTGRPHITGVALIDFYRVNPLFPEPDGGTDFIAKLNASASDFVFSTNFVGSLSQPTPRAIALDGEGAIYVAGKITADGFFGATLPLKNALQSAPGGGIDMYLSKLTPSGSEILFSTYWGGTRNDETNGLAVSQFGKAYLAGTNLVAGFPTTWDAYDGTQNGTTDGAIVALDTVGSPAGPPFLVFGAASPFTLTTAAPTALYRLRAPLGSSVTLDLVGAASGRANAMYLAWDKPPTPSVYDQAAAVRGQSSQRLVIPYMRSGTAYVLAEAVKLVGGSNAVSITTTASTLGLESVSPARAGTNTRVTAVIRGGGFKPGTQFALVAFPGAFVLMMDVTRISNEQVEGTFDLTGIPPRKYFLYAAGEGNQTAFIQDGFEVTASPRRSVLEVGLSAVDTVRAKYPSRLSLSYENAGDVEMSAPLLLVRGPQGSKLWLESDPEEKPDTLQVLAVGPSGAEGKLAPGARGEIPLFFQIEDPGDVDFRISVFSPNRSEYVGWETIAAPPGFPAQSWEPLRGPASAALGARWVDYQESIASQAMRLGRRGLDAASARAAFRSALEKGSGLSRPAVRGRILDRTTGAPLRGELAGAFDGPTLVATSRTDANGYLLIECLDAGATYELRASGWALEAASVTLPADGSDLLGAQFLATADPATFGAKPAACGSATLPGRAILPPGELFTLLDVEPLRVVASVDPNDKEGPEGEGPEGSVDPIEPLEYSIRFTNLPSASAPARQVVITDDLDPGLDWQTFQVKEASVGGRPLSLDTGRSGGASRRSDTLGANRVFLDVVPASQWPGLNVRCDYDPRAGKISWTFEQVDPLTGEPAPENSAEGFLPPNKVHPEGEGQVTFTVKPMATLPEGDEITNDAEIRFDREQPIQTPPVRNVIRRSVVSPQIPDLPFPKNDTTTPVELDTYLSWKEAARQLVFDVYIWTGDVRPSEPEVRNTPRSNHVPVTPLQPGTVYHWQVIGHDVGASSFEGPVWSFVTAQPSEPPAKPEGLEPASGAVDVPVRPTLKWRKDPSALAYSVYIWRSTDARPDEPHIAGIVGAEIQLAEPLEPGTEYKWQVVAENAGGKTASEERSFTTEEAAPEGVFRRGDANGSGKMDLSDAIFGLRYLFSGGVVPKCHKAIDVDDNGIEQITDAIALLGYLFQGTREPPPPFAACGVDPTADALTCEEFPPCQ